MTRELLPYINNTLDGVGAESLVSFANRTMDYYLIPLFIGVFYILALYLASRNEYKMGGQIILISLIFFILGMIAQVWTQFNQMIMFILGLGLLVGIIVSFVENARG